MKTKLHLIIMCLLLCFAGGGELYAWKYPTSEPPSPFSSGDGSSSKPYEIRNAQDLANLAYMVCEGGEDYSGKHFVMTNDITLNENLVNANCTDCNTGNFQAWTPIGKYGFWSDKKFKGDFNGNSHTISGLFIAAKDNYNGLFGVVNEGTIRNLTIADSYMCASYPFYSSNYYGFIAGEATNATILNCHVKNSCIKNTDDSARHKLSAGGLVGHCKKGDIIRKCSFNGNFILKSFDKSQLIEAGGMSGSGSVKLYSCTAKGKFKVTGSPSIRVAGMTYEVEEAYGCVAGMDFDIQTHGDYYTGTSGDNAIVVAGFSHITSGECTQCVTYGTIKVGNDGNPVKVQPLSEAPNYKRFRYNIRIGTFCSEEECNGFVAHNQCAAYTNVELYLHNDSKGNAYITSFGLWYSESRRSLLELKNCIVAGRHTIKSTPGICYNPVTLFDYRKSAVRDIDEAWKKVKETRYCTYVNDVKDENVYFGDGDFKEDKPLFVSISSDELKGEALLNKLNDLSEGSNQWGKLTGTNSDLDGLPMPISCGGKPLEYTGVGTETDPYVINTENDLDKLKEAVNTGTTDFSGKYFQLGSDIRITGTLDECIGKDYDHPFKGHFDGNGHAIKGLHKSLFGYMYGTVKNLALVDCDIWVNGYATALARQVGNTDNKAEVSNCYVSGIIASSASWNSQGCASTFAFQVADGSSIHDCYFKGSFVLKNQALSSYFVAGIAVYDSKDVNISADSPQGIFNCYASFDVKEESYGSTYYNCYGICNRNNDSSSGNYFVCSDSRLQTYNGGIQLNSESELNGKFNGKTGWLQGVYRPVLDYAKKYAATTPEKTPTTVYFDAIPEANPTENYIYNVTVSGDPYADKTVWELPNMAVYVESEQKDYITNGYLDQSADFKYKRAKGATATEGQLRYELTQTEKGYHMVCLPGNVERTDLPEGAKVMIIGKIQKGVDNKEQVNVVMVDTIPAGVPCMLYVPTTKVTTGTTIPLVMRSGIVSEPTINEAYSNMKGTFSAATATDACVTAQYSGTGETLPVFVKTSGDTSVKPFTAWLAGATGDNVQIVDYVLLDEENEAMTVTLAGLNSKKDAPKTTNVKMRRTVKLGQWNTICLPFDLTKTEVENVFGSGTKVEELSSLTYDETSQSYTLVFAAVTETDGSFMKAGTPYLIKPGTTKSEEKTSVQLYGFSNKNIICPADENYLYKPDGKEVTNNVNSTTLTMQGEYNHRMISPDEATDVKSLYVISGDKIYYVDSNVEMKGFRCYFVVEETVSGSGAKLFSGARLMHSDGTSTELRLIKAEPTGDADAVYDLLGRKRDGQTKGIVIKNKIKVLKK